jgi:hypothetical protein
VNEKEFATDEIRMNTDECWNTIRDGIYLCPSVFICGGNMRHLQYGELNEEEATLLSLRLKS